MTADNRSTLLSIAENAEVTGIGWRSLSRFYSLPDNLGGLRVLDLCSGMSDFAFSLRQRGALAYALDVLYGDLAAFRLRHRHSFGAITRDVFNVEPESEQAEEIYRSYVQGFESGLLRQPCFYIAGSATQIPFEADTFDATTNADDGLVLAPLGHVGQAPNHMKWTFDASKAVRLKLDSDGGPASLVEFTEAA